MHDLEAPCAEAIAPHPYEPLLKDVLKPGRYIGGESGERRKPWDSVQCHFCLAFPDVYDIGMSHLGYKILYKLLNDHPEIAAERCYTPWVDMQAKLRAAGEPLRSLENARPLRDFEVVGFSLQFELTYTNVLTMLELGGIPLRTSQRAEDDPLIVAGGPVATHAEPIAPFIDAFVIGDAEELATELALCWSRGRASGLSRAERLEALSRLSGVYVPSLYDTAVDAETGLEVVTRSRSAEAAFPVKRRLVEDLSRFPFPDDGPVGGPEAIFDRVSVEVARGCTEGCRFCQAGMIYRPVRERAPEEVVGTVLRALEKSGHDQISLTALSTADVSCISPLIRQLVEKTAPERVSLSVASLRAYGLAEDLLDDMRRVRASGLTFAPEAGTQRMRDVINKNVTEEQLLETAERVFSRGFDTMKLYFIIGLPTEQDEDVLGIIQVARNALAVADRVGCRRARITVSASVHVPKPHTPFQWCAMDTRPDVERKQTLLRNELGRHKRISLRLHDASASVLEGVFARGDRRLADVLESAFRAGARFDSWDDQLNHGAWEEAFKTHGIDPDMYLGTLPVNGRVPWDHLDIGLEQGFLAREYRKALGNHLSPPCGKAQGMFIHHTNAEEAHADERRLVCYDCGVACDMTSMRNQRIGFLERMGAIAAPRPPAGQLVPATHLHRRNTRPEDHRPRQPGLTRQRYRLHYEKIGPSALLGHLDLMRELMRILRRSGLRLAYTQGFRPKPRMVFGPALALGVYGLDEPFEVELVDGPSPSALLAAINQHSIRGLRFTQAHNLTAKGTSLGAAVATAHYLFAFAHQVAPPEQVAQRVSAFLAQPTAIVNRNVKGIYRRIDVRPLVRSLVVDSESGRAALERCGLFGQITSVTAEMVLDPQGSARPLEIVESIFGEPVAHQCVRLGLGLTPVAERASRDEAEPEFPDSPDNPEELETATVLDEVELLQASSGVDICAIP
jgi:radical SAM family uncharacterized protein/radical SAM-linked protein